MENSTTTDRTDSPEKVERYIRITLLQPEGLTNGFRVDIKTIPALPTLVETLKEQSKTDPMLMAYMVMMGALQHFIKASQADATERSTGGIIT
jgi:hypothetical protein